MQRVHRKLTSWLLATMLATTPLISGAAASDYQTGSSPSAGAVFFDALVMRPVGLAGTVAGTAVFLVTLPFSALGGNMGEVGKEMVVAPAKYTFIRPVGEF